MLVSTHSFNSSICSVPNQIQASDWFVLDSSDTERKSADIRGGLLDNYQMETEASQLKSELKLLDRGGIINRDGMSSPSAVYSQE